MHTVVAQGASIPAIGLGTWLVQGEACEHAVRTALELGYRHVDTARAYDNEREVGAGIRASGVPRDAIFVATKVWHADLAPDRVSTSVDASRSDLGLDVLDLVYIHWPSPEWPWEPALDRLFELREQGRLRHVGVSNFNSTMLREAAARGPVAAIQVEYHPWLGQGAVVQAARDVGAALVAYSPLAHGRIHDDATLARIGAAHGKTAAQVALRWLVQQPGVVAIPKSTSRAHLAENLEVFDFALSEDEMRAIDGLEQNLRLLDPPMSPVWDPPSGHLR